MQKGIAAIIILITFFVAAVAVWLVGYLIPGFGWLLPPIVLLTTTGAMYFIYTAINPQSIVPDVPVAPPATPPEIEG